MEGRSLKDFVYERTLTLHGDLKKIYIFGHFPGQEGKALVKLEKPTFEEAQVKLFTGESSPILEEAMYFNNDVYHKYFLQLAPEISKVQCDLVYPVPDDLIAKYTESPKHIFRETAEIYHKYTKPFFIDKIPDSHIQWVYNIIDKSKETELTVFRNELFTL